MSPLTQGLNYRSACDTRLAIHPSEFHLPSHRLNMYVVMLEDIPEASHALYSLHRNCGFDSPEVHVMSFQQCSCRQFFGRNIHTFIQNERQRIAVSPENAQLISICQVVSDRYAAQLHVRPNAAAAAATAVLLLLLQ